MKMSEAALNIGLLVCTIIGTGGAAYIAFERGKLLIKQKAAADSIRQADKAAAELQRQKDKDEIKMGQQKIEALETANRMLMEKNHSDNKLYQTEIALANERHISESRKILERKMMGEKSKPVLHFGTFDQEGQGSAYYYISNEGEDPAVNLKGIFFFTSGGVDNYPAGRVLDR